MPLIIDNAESVVEIRKSKCQIISLVVDGGFKKLEVVAADNEEKTEKIA